MTECIAVDTQQLSHTTGTVAELLADTRNELKYLYEAVEAMNNMWIGPANTAFRSQFAEDCQAAYALCDVFNQYVNSMKYAQNAYDSCEKKVIEMIESIRI